jgi:2-polyprenyl-3-methyl-5-hydroxy-6-metoxy-1,4-benzoquinol methylase
MSDGSHVDRRFDQTRHDYAASDLEIIEEAHRYGDHVFGLFRPFVGRRVLEVGAGIGTMTRKLMAAADLVIGIEPNASCLARLEANMRGESRFTLLPCHLEECDLEDLRRKQLDTVYCVNVLEHIEDDVAALKMFRDAIVSGGHVLIYVPAIQAAYGPLDAELGHHRRYSKRTLSAAFSAADLDVQLARGQGPAPQRRAGEAVRTVRGAMGPADRAADSTAAGLVARRGWSEALGFEQCLESLKILAHLLTWLLTKHPRHC